MKKRLLSLAMALILCLSLLPPVAFAAEEKSPDDRAAPEEARQTSSAVSSDGELFSAEPARAEQRAVLPTPKVNIPGDRTEYPVGTRLTITADLQPGQVIRYTVNDTEPTEDSPLYERPISIAGSCMLRAAVFSGSSHGPVIDGVYNMKAEPPGPEIRDAPDAYYTYNFPVLPDEALGDVDLILSGRWYLPKDATVNRIFAMSWGQIVFLCLQAGSCLTVPNGICVPSDQKLNLVNVMLSSELDRAKPMLPARIVASGPSGSSWAAIGTSPEIPCGRIGFHGCRVEAAPGVPGGLAIGGRNCEIEHAYAQVVAPTGTVPGIGGTYDLQNGTLQVQGVTHKEGISSRENGWLFLEKPLTEKLPNFDKGFLLEKGKPGKIKLDSYGVAPIIRDLDCARYSTASEITIPSGYKLQVFPPEKLSIGIRRTESDPLCARLILEDGAVLHAPKAALIREDGAIGTVIVLPGGTWVEPSVNPVTVSEGSAELAEAYQGQQVKLRTKELTGREVLDHWETVPADLEIVDNSFTMPAEPVSIRGVYKEDPLAPKYENGVFLLSSARDFAWVADRIQEGRVIGSIRMTQDITLEPNQPRLGSEAHPFVGTFDGGFHTLTVDLTVSSADGRSCGGLIDWVGEGKTLICNLTMAGTAKVRTSKPVGGFVGTIQQGTDIALERCVSRMEIHDSDSGTDYHSGFLADNHAYFATVRFRHCVFLGSITASRGASAFMAAEAARTSFDSCYAAGTFNFISQGSGGDIFPSGAACTNCAVQIPLPANVRVGSDIRQMTAEEFASGAACWYLNKERVGDMRQNLGTDPLPLPDPLRGEVLLENGSYVNVVKVPHTITVNGGTASPTEAKIGQPVTLTIIIPDGCALDYLESVPKVDISEKNTFIMPDEPVTITAHYRERRADEIPIKEEYFGAPALVKWLAQNVDQNGDGLLDLAERSEVLVLNTREVMTDGLLRADSLKYFPKLKRLSYQVVDAMVLDLRYNPDLEYLSLSGTAEHGNIDIDLSACQNLKEVKIQCNKIGRIILPDSAPLELLHIDADITAIDVSPSCLQSALVMLMPRAYFVESASVPLDSLAMQPQRERIGQTLGGKLEGDILQFDSDSPILRYQYDIDSGSDIHYVWFSLLRSGPKLSPERCFPDPQLRALVAGERKDGLSAENIKDCVRLTSSDPLAPPIRSLEGLEYLPNLHSLELRNVDIDQKAPVRMEQITSLKIVDSPELTGLPLRAMPNLEGLNIKNCPHFNELDLSVLPALRSLNMNGTSISEVYPASNKMLKSLGVDNCRTTVIGHSEFLERFSAVGNEYLVDGPTVALSSLPGQPKRELMNLDSSYFLDENTLKLPEKGGLTYRYQIAEGMELTCTLYRRNESLEINTDNFPDPVLRKAILELDPNKNALLNPEDLDQLSGLIINLDKLQPEPIWDATGIELLPNLEKLSINEHLLTSLDVSGLSLLRDLECSENRLTELYIGNGDLSSLRCQNNQLTHLDLSGALALKYLDCSGNQLAALDVSKLSFLDELICTNNLRIVKDGSSTAELEGFQAAKALNVQGGSFDGGRVTFAPDSDTITYTYQCGPRFTADFTLKRAEEGSMRLDGSGENILVTSETGCTLVLADYDLQGRMNAVERIEIPQGTAGKAFAFRDARRAFLIDANGAPVCPLLKK